jgi:hypothetical protein
MKLKAIKNHIIATEGDFGAQTTKAGIIIGSTTGTSEGIVPRWFHITAVGPDIDWVKEDDWVLVEHGRWTEGFSLDQTNVDAPKYWRLDPDGLMMVSDEKPDQLNIASADHTVFAEKKVR